MGKRALEIVLLSAESLGRPFSRMVVAARVNISSHPIESAQWTRVDTVGGINPRWNQPLHFTVKYHANWGRFQDFLNVDLFDIMPDGTFRYIGGVQIPLANWIALAGEQATAVHFPPRCQVNTGGFLHLSYRLGPYISSAAVLNNPVAKTAIGALATIAGAVINLT